MQSFLMPLNRSGDQPLNDVFPMFGRRYKKWAYLYWTLNEHTTAAEWALVENFHVSIDLLFLTQKY